METIGPRGLMVTTDGSQNRTGSPRTLGSLLVDRMASFRSVGSVGSTPSTQDDLLNEARRCFSERLTVSPLSLSFCSS